MRASVLVAALSTVMLAGCVDGPVDPFAHGSVDPTTDLDHAATYVCVSVYDDMVVDWCWDWGMPELTLAPDGSYSDAGGKSGDYLVRGGAILFDGHYAQYNPSSISTDEHMRVLTLRAASDDGAVSYFRYESKGDEPEEDKNETPAPPEGDVVSSLAGDYYCVRQTDWEGSGDCWTSIPIEMEGDGTWSRGRGDHPDEGTWRTHGDTIVFDPQPFGDDPWSVTVTGSHTFEIAVDDGEDTVYLYERPHPAADVDRSLVGVWVCQTVQTDQGREACEGGGGPFELRDDGRWVSERAAEDGRWKATSERVYILEDDYPDAFGPATWGRAYLEDPTTIRFERVDLVYWYTLS